MKIESIAPNVAAGGARSWPLIDSIAQPMGRLETEPDGSGFVLRAFDGTPYRVASVRMRGRGCAASLAQQRRFALFQIIGKSPTGGGQAFVDTAALDQAAQLGPAGALGVSPPARRRHRLRSQRTRDRSRAPARQPPRRQDRPRAPVGRDDQQRHGFDAKPEFGNTVYFMSNTTNVSVGGIARGMVRVGTPVAKVDAFARCDPSSDGTLTWRYESIRTGVPGRPRLYGWIPARCPARMR